MDKMSVSSSKNGRSDLTWNTILPELLEKVLTPLYSPFKPKDMARLREVCTHWRDVIDEHFHFRLTVNDKKMDVTLLSHLRPSPSVIVSSLMAKLDPEASIFKDPSAITELKIWGQIPPRNFQQLMIDAVNLKKLSVSEKALCTKGLMNPIPNMKTEFQKAWTRLTSLSITDPMVDNLFEMLSTEMPNLQTFKLAFTSLESFLNQSHFSDFTTTMFSFLNRNQNLSVFYLSVRDVYRRLPEDSGLFPVYTGDKQFKIMRLFFFPKAWHSWLPLVKVQRSLKSLQVAIYRSEHEHPAVIFNFADLCLITALEATLQLNRTTLTCIQLKNLSLSTALNAGIFAEMSNLRRLKLQRYQNERSPGISLIFNLGMISNSIEVLNLQGFTCDPVDLLRIADRLEKIKHVDLVEIQNAGNGDPAVSYRILGSFARKKDIRAMMIFPLEFSTVVENSHDQEHVNGKHFLLVKGFRIEVLFAGGNYYVKFNFGK